MNPYESTYKSQHIQTASREQVLLMLYEGAIRFLRIARTACEEGNIEKFHNNTVKAQRILIEFMTTLDVEVGGEVAKNLFKLYEYLHYRLVQANLKKDVTMVDEVVGHLEELKQTWEEAIGIAKKQDVDLVNQATEGHVYSA